MTVLKKSNHKKPILPDVSQSDKQPFPYVPEKFSRIEKNVLLKFFTNWDKPVFAIYNLSQEVVGAMFSRYSRTVKSVRRLFLDEFWDSKELGLKERIRGKKYDKALLRTREFYKKVFAEYGDDSVIQMGSVHIAFEYISQIIGAKAVEDQRVASAYIEKSTRYVDFGSKSNGRYLYMDPPEIMKTRYKKEFIRWNNSLFEAYTKYLPVVIAYLRTKYSIDDQAVQDTKTGKIIFFKDLNGGDKEIVKTAYDRALKAKALDTIRFFLPLTTVTNLGAHFSGQAAELTINKMLVSPFEEVRFYGKAALEELMKVSPNFLQNIDHPFGEIARAYRKEINSKSLRLGSRWDKKIKKSSDSEKAAVLICYDKDADIKIASEIIFTASSKNLSKAQIVSWAKKVKSKEGKSWSPTLTKIINGAVPVRNEKGRTRRQKLPRAFEHAYAEIEFCTDIGAYKDLQRNRLSSTQRQGIMVDSLYIPEEYYAPELKTLLKDYLSLASLTNKLHKKISHLKSQHHSSGYIGIMGNKVRFTVKANLRQWCFFAELRTISGGHPSYRRALQEAAKLIIKKMPFTKDLFVNIDWVPDYGLGRLKAEIYTQKELFKLHKKNG